MHISDDRKIDKRFLADIENSGFAVVKEYEDRYLVVSRNIVKTVCFNPAEAGTIDTNSMLTWLNGEYKETLPTFIRQKLVPKLVLKPAMPKPTSRNTVA